MTFLQALEVAKNKAAHTPCKYSVASIALDSRGNVIDTARNTPRFGKKGGSVHSEQALMKKHGKRIKSIIIFRVTKGGKIKPMDPCSVCATKANELGITIHSLV